MAKGGNWERVVAKRLSLWWTHGERDDVFWREKSSGGRATTRAKSGQSTANSYGDIVVIDPIGQPLIDLCVLELKSGYGDWSVQDVLETTGKKPQTFEKFAQQVCDAVKADGGEKYPVLIVKKDRRNPLIALNSDLFDEINALERVLLIPYIDIVLKMRDKKETLTMVRFDDFLEWCQPETIITLAKEKN
jgi:hypothetical protein